MATFNNINDLVKYVQSKQGATNLVLSNESIKKSLKDAADMLYKIMHRQLESYYSSYTPIVYHRTYNLLNSLRISPIKQTGKSLSISVYFDGDSATHPSLFGGEDGFVPILLNEGWQWKNDIGVYHLSNYEGFHFIENSIDEFNKINKWGFKITKEGQYKGQDI